MKMAVSFKSSLPLDLPADIHEEVAEKEETHCMLVSTGKILKL